MNAGGDLVLRPASPDDLPVVEAIEAASFVDPWPRSSLRSELRPDAMRVPLAAERNGELVGYVMAWVVADELHIINLATRGGERRRGVGTILLRAVCEEARSRGCSLATLEVRRSNESACIFYRKNGFDLLGVRPNYYRNPREDALIMTLPL